MKPLSKSSVENRIKAQEAESRGEVRKVIEEK